MALVGGMMMLQTRNAPILFAIAAGALVFLAGCASAPGARSLEHQLRRRPDTDLRFEVLRAPVRAYSLEYGYVEGSPFLVPRDATGVVQRDGLAQGVPFAVRIRYRSDREDEYRSILLRAIAEASVVTTEHILRTESGSAFFLTAAAAYAGGEVTVYLAMPEWWPEDQPNSFTVPVAPWETYRKPEHTIVVNGNYHSFAFGTGPFPGQSGASVDVDVAVHAVAGDATPALFDVTMRIDGIGFGFERVESVHDLILPAFARISVFAPGFAGVDAVQPSDTFPEATNASPPEVSLGPGDPGGPGGYGGTLAVRYSEAVGRRAAMRLVPRNLTDLSGGEGGEGSVGGIIWMRQERTVDGEIEFFYTNEGRAPAGADGAPGEDGRIRYMEVAEDGTE